MNSVNRRDFVKTGAAAATCDVSYEQQEFRHRRGRHPLFLPILRAAWSISGRCLSLPSKKKGVCSFLCAIRLPVPFSYSVDDFLL
jgi:hypothetical protein